MERKTLLRGNKLRELLLLTFLVLAGTMAAMMHDSILLKAAAVLEDAFEFRDGMVTGFDESIADVVIPETIHEEKVTGIQSAAFYWMDITSVTFPDTITFIGSNAFESCENLSLVVFKGEPPVVEYSAFENCSENLVFQCPALYKEDYERVLWNFIKDGQGYYTLETYGEEPAPELPESEDAGLVYEEYKEGYTVSGYTGKGGAVKIPKIYQGKPIVGIASHAFDGIGADSETAGVLSITSISMPDTVSFIGDYAFAKCIQISEITLSPNVITIGEHAFQYCNSLTEIKVPKSVKEVKELAFTMCSNLKNIVVEEGNINYKDIDGVFYNMEGTTLINYPAGRSAEEYIIPNDTKIIHNDAFKFYYADTAGKSLKKVVFPESLESIGDRAFMQTSLVQITISSEYTLGKYVFDGCKMIETVVVSEGVTELSDGLFYGLEAMKEVSLPSTLKKIGYRTFDRCLSLKEIRLPEGLTVIGEEAFEGSGLTKIRIPSTVTQIGPRAFYLSRSLKSLTFQENAVIQTIGAYAFNNCHSLEEVILPTSVKTLENGAFSHCYSLTGIDLPNSITTLEDVVFAGSGLESIELPDSITKIGTAVFRGSNFTGGKGLKSVRMPAYLESLGNCTFEMCESLEKVDFPETVKIQTIPVDTFFQCQSLMYIYLPKSIKSTQACAFANCTDGLVIEYAYEKIERSIFDCYTINPGDSYELREDGFYYTLGEPLDDDYSNGAYKELEGLNSEEIKEVKSKNGIIKSKKVSSIEAACGCGSGTLIVRLTPSVTPVFKYKPASSGELADGGNGSGNNKENESEIGGREENGKGSQVENGAGDKNGKDNEDSTETGIEKGKETENEAGKDIIDNLEEKAVTENRNRNTTARIPSESNIVSLRKNKVPITMGAPVKTGDTVSDKQILFLIILSSALFMIFRVRKSKN
jgi:hypothetical protein